LLKAVGVKDDKEVESTILKSAGKPDKIKIKADRNSLSADGQDLSYITIEVTDKEGNIQPNADNLLQFTISGPGVIAGVDNANLKDLDRYTGNTRKVWHGRALVVIKSMQKTGNIKVKVSSPGLPAAFITIKAKKFI
jgi:beta-galactosidase